MDFDYGTVQTASAAMFGTNVDVGMGIVDLLVTGLVKDGAFSVIERKGLEKILVEQNLSNSNRADPTCAGSRCVCAKSCTPSDPNVTRRFSSR